VRLGRAGGERWCISEVFWILKAQDCQENVMWQIIVGIGGVRLARLRFEKLIFCEGMGRSERHDNAVIGLASSLSGACLGRSAKEMWRDSYVKLQRKRMRIKLTVTFSG
jgi:hypothetical protein